MPKLENFSTYVKIDGNPHAKNNLNYEITSGDVVSIYYEKDRDSRVLQKAWGEYYNWTDSTDTPYPSLAALTADLDIYLFSSTYTGLISEANSTDIALNAGAAFTGEWEDVTAFDSVVVAVKTDQNGNYQVQFSPDGINQDSTLTRYYRTNSIEAPHRFTITRKYVRVVYSNTSASNQTYLRLQTIYGQKSNLNAPTDSVLAQDFDATVVRPTDFNTEVALGRRQGYELWNKFGYNNDADIGTEVLASFGGTFNPITTATTLSIVSTSGNDTNGGTGTNSLVIYGLDANRDIQIEVITMAGVTPVVTTSTWFGINRVAMFLCGSGQINAGTITVTAVTGGSTLAQMPAGGGVTQQCIFYVPRNYQFIAEWVWINTLKQSGASPRVTVKFWIYSAVSNGKQEVYKVDIDTTVTNTVSENPNLPFPITEQTVCWLEVTTDKNDTIVNGRFSGILVRDVDA